MKQFLFEKFARETEQRRNEMKANIADCTLAHDNKRRIYSIENCDGVLHSKVQTN